MFRKNKANIIAKGVFLSAGIVGLLSGFGILSLGVAYFASGFVMRSLCKHYLLRVHHFDDLLQKYRRQKQYSKKHILAMMWPNAWRDGLVTVTLYLTGQATVLLSSNFLTLYETGIYSFSMQVINAIIGISYGMFGAYVPSIQSAYVSRNRDLMRTLYAKSMACGLYLSIAGIMVFATIGIPIVRWLRHDFTIERPVFDGKVNHPYKAGPFNKEIDFKGMAEYRGEYRRAMEKIDRKKNEIKSLEKSIYGNVLVIMTIFVALFSLVNINVNLAKDSAGTDAMVRMLVFNCGTIGSIAFLIAFASSVMKDGKLNLSLILIGTVLFLVSLCVANFL